MNRFVWAPLVCATVLCSACAWQAPQRYATGLTGPPPRLVVVLAIDQLRADLLSRYAPEFLPANGPDGVGGFRYLVDQGTYYPLAEHRVLNPVTSAGHASLSTGTWPADHGMVLNSWYDPVKRRKVYGVEDIGMAHAGEALKSPGHGRGPANLRAPTLGDSLKEVSPQSKVVSISLKDRAAIAMAGRRADIALWRSYWTKTWVSSHQYVKALPEWVKAANVEAAKRATTKSVWEEPGKFRHEFTAKDYMWVATPAANAVVADMVERALDGMKLGQDATPDLLFVSLSSHDYTGHGKGIASPEMRAITLSDDATIARILRAIARRLPGGLATVSVVLTGDHGVGAHPKEYDTTKVSAGYVDRKKLAKRLDDMARMTLGTPPDPDGWVLATKDMHIYLNPKSVAGKTPDEVAGVEAAIARLAEQEPSVFRAFTSSDIRKGRLPGGVLGDVLKNSYVRGRSGNVIAVPKPNWLPRGATTHHWSAWSYDRYVPLILAGKGIRRGRIPRIAPIVDVAPTLAYLLGIVPPAMSRGKLLTEALQ